MLQDLVAFHRHSTKQLTPGLYLGYLKLSSSVDQIRVLVSQQTPNVLCHSRIRDNANVSRYRPISGGGCLNLSASVSLAFLRVFVLQRRVGLDPEAVNHR